MHESEARLVEARRHSAKNRAELETSAECGCFYCLHTFPPSAIEEWVDEDAHGVGQTALCPGCRSDAVIGSDSGFPIDRVFLARMRARWFW